MGTIIQSEDLADNYANLIRMPFIPEQVYTNLPSLLNSSSF
jgi:hypothetical protein